MANDFDILTAARNLAAAIRDSDAAQVALRDAHAQVSALASAAIKAGAAKDAADKAFHELLATGMEEPKTMTATPAPIATKAVTPQPPRRK